MDYWFSESHTEDVKLSLRVKKHLVSEKSAYQKIDVFETPEAVLAVSHRGFGGVSEKMHKFVLEHIIPVYWQYRERPVLYNDWEGCMFDFNQRILLGLAKKAKDLGCELFVLDDGWFGKRNDDKAGLGDYTVNRKKLPGGLKALADRVGITRSVIVNALRKFESAGVIESKSSGMKGTYIKVLNDVVFEEVEALKRQLNK